MWQTTVSLGPRLHIFAEHFHKTLSPIGNCRVLLGKSGFQVGAGRLPLGIQTMMVKHTEAEQPWLLW